jgi:hypothetical protein
VNGFRRDVVHGATWAHARRHFHAALESDPSRMRTVSMLIAQLYGIERTARERGLRGEELRLLREHASRPALERLYAYLLEIHEQLLPPAKRSRIREKLKIGPR